MPTEPVTFPGGGGDSLAARLELPISGEPTAWALFAHCFTCSKNLKAAVRLSRGLSARGIGVLRFDFTGLGESEGDFADTNFSSNVEDLVRAAEWMEHHYGGPQLLVGHSLGGAAVLHAARRISSTRAVVTIGAPSEPSHVLRHIQESRSEIEAEGEARVTIGGRAFSIRRQFLDDLEASRMEDAVRALPGALLVMHSPVDDVVGIDNAARLYDMARHPKSYISLDDADHLLMKEADADYAAEVVAAWAGRYVEQEGPDRDSELVASGDRVVSRTGARGFRTDLRVRRHALVADEPASVGGTDTGPTPYDLVVAGLGACTSMTLRMYADRKGWPLEEIRVRLRHRKLHRKDEAVNEEGGDERLDRMDREIELVGDLDDGQRSRLLEIAERCPVHRTLEAGVRVETALKEG
jgi:putative redox protein